MPEFAVPPRWSTPPLSWTILTNKRNAETQKWWSDGNVGGQLEDVELFPMQVLNRLNSFAANGNMWAWLERFSFEYKMNNTSQMVFRSLDGFTRLALHWYAAERGVNHASHWEQSSGGWQRVLVLGGGSSRF